MPLHYFKDITYPLRTEGNKFYLLGHEYKGKWSFLHANITPKTTGISLLERNPKFSVFCGIDYIETDYSPTPYLAE